MGSEGLCCEQSFPFDGYTLLDFCCFISNLIRKALIPNATYNIMITPNISNYIKVNYLTVGDINYKDRCNIIVYFI